MNKVRLSSSGHYPNRIVEVTDEELEQIKEAAKYGGYLAHPSGRAVVNDLGLMDRETLDDPIPTFVIYD